MTEAEVIFPFQDPDNFKNITGEHKLNKGSTTERDMGKVTHIMLHQTACRLGLKPERYYDVACHCAVLYDGTVLYVNNLKHYVWHGHGFNNFSIGIEVDGHFAGIEGDKRTVWKGGGRTHDLTPEQIQGVKNLLTWLVGQGVALGGGFTSLVAHRQGSDQRQGDPGSALWTAIAPWARETLGLKVPWYETLGSGLYLPRQWEIGSLFGWSGNIDRTGIGMVQIVTNEMDKARSPSGMRPEPLEVDGITGPKTRAGVARLNGYLGLTKDSRITSDTVERLQGAPEYQEFVSWLDRVCRAHKIPARLRGNDLFDALETYPEEPEGGTEPAPSPDPEPQPDPDPEPPEVCPTCGKPEPPKVCPTCGKPL